MKRAVRAIFEVVASPARPAAPDEAGSEESRSAAEDEEGLADAAGNAANEGAEPSLDPKSEAADPSAAKAIGDDAPRSGKDEASPGRRLDFDEAPSNEPDPAPVIEKDSQKPESRPTAELPRTLSEVAHRSESQTALRVSDGAGDPAPNPAPDPAPDLAPGHAPVSSGVAEIVSDPRTPVRLPRTQINLQHGAHGNQASTARPLPLPSTPTPSRYSLRPPGPGRAMNPGPPSMLRGGSDMRRPVPGLDAIDQRLKDVEEASVHSLRAICGELGVAEDGEAGALRSRAMNALLEARVKSSSRRFAGEIVQDNSGNIFGTGALSQSRAVNANPGAPSGFTETGTGQRPIETTVRTSNLPGLPESTTPGQAHVTSSVAGPGTSGQPRAGSAPTSSLDRNRPIAPAVGGTSSAIRNSETGEGWMATNAWDRSDVNEPRLRDDIRTNAAVHGQDGSRPVEHGSSRRNDILAALASEGNRSTLRSHGAGGATESVDAQYAPRMVVSNTELREQTSVPLKSPVIHGRGPGATADSAAGVATATPRVDARPPNADRESAVDVTERNPRTNQPPRRPSPDNMSGMALLPPANDRDPTLPAVSGNFATAASAAEARQAEPNYPRPNRPDSLARESGAAHTPTLNDRYAASFKHVPTGISHSPTGSNAVARDGPQVSESVLNADRPSSFQHPPPPPTPSDPTVAEIMNANMPSSRLRSDVAASLRMSKKRDRAPLGVAESEGAEPSGPLQGDFAEGVQGNSRDLDAARNGFSRHWEDTLHADSPNADTGVRPGKRRRLPERVSMDSAATPAGASQPSTVKPFLQVKSPTGPFDGPLAGAVGGPSSGALPDPGSAALDSAPSGRFEAGFAHAESNAPAAPRSGHAPNGDASDLAARGAMPSIRAARTVVDSSTAGPTVSYKASSAKEDSAFHDGSVAGRAEVVADSNSVGDRGVPTNNESRLRRPKPVPISARGSVSSADIIRVLQNKSSGATRGPLRNGLSRLEGEDDVEREDGDRRDALPGSAFGPPRGRPEPKPGPLLPARTRSRRLSILRGGPRSLELRANGELTGRAVTDLRPRLQQNVPTPSSIRRNGSERHEPQITTDSRVAVSSAAKKIIASLDQLSEENRERAVKRRRSVMIEPPPPMAKRLRLSDSDSVVNTGGRSWFLEAMNQHVAKALPGPAASGRRPEATPKRTPRPGIVRARKPATPEARQTPLSESPSTAVRSGSAPQGTIREAGNLFGAGRVASREGLEGTGDDESRSRSARASRSKPPRFEAFGTTTEVPSAATAGTEAASADAGEEHSDSAVAKASVPDVGDPSFLGGGSATVANGPQRMASTNSKTQGIFGVLGDSNAKASLEEGKPSTKFQEAFGSGSQQAATRAAETPFSFSKPLSSSRPAGTFVPKTSSLAESTAGIAKDAAPSGETTFKPDGSEPDGRRQPNQAAPAGFTIPEHGTAVTEAKAIGGAFARHNSAGSGTGGQESLSDGNAGPQSKPLSFDAGDNLATANPFGSAAADKGSGSAGSKAAPVETPAQAEASAAPKPLSSTFEGSAESSQKAGSEKPDKNEAKPPSTTAPVPFFGLAQSSSAFPSTSNSVFSAAGSLTGQKDSAGSVATLPSFSSAAPKSTESVAPLPSFSFTDHKSAEPKQDHAPTDPAASSQESTREGVEATGKRKKQDPNAGLLTPPAAGLSAFKKAGDTALGSANVPSGFSSEIKPETAAQNPATISGSLGAPATGAPPAAGFGSFTAGAGPTFPLSGETPASAAVAPSPFPPLAAAKEPSANPTSSASSAFPTGLSSSLQGAAASAPTPDATAPPPFTSAFGGSASSGADDKPAELHAATGDGGAQAVGPTTGTDPSTKAPLFSFSSPLAQVAPPSAGAKLFTGLTPSHGNSTDGEGKTHSNSAFPSAQVGFTLGGAAQSGTPAPMAGGLGLGASSAASAPSTDKPSSVFSTPGPPFGSPSGPSNAFPAASANTGFGSGAPLGASITPNAGSGSSANLASTGSPWPGPSSFGASAPPNPFSQATAPAFGGSLPPPSMNPPSGPSTVFQFGSAAPPSAPPPGQASPVAPAFGQPAQPNLAVSGFPSSGASGPTFGASPFQQTPTPTNPFANVGSGQATATPSNPFAQAPGAPAANQAPPSGIFGAPASGDTGNQQPVFNMGSATPSGRRRMLRGRRHSSAR